jgi:hypothetical protein
VYLFEVAPEQRKGLMSSLGCVCLGLGVALGVLVVAAVSHFMPQGGPRKSCLSLALVPVQLGCC